MSEQDIEKSQQLRASLRKQLIAQHGRNHSRYLAGEPVEHDSIEARLGQYLQARREWQRLTADQIAARAKIDKATIVALEHGLIPVSDIPLALLTRLAQALNDSTETLAMIAGKPTTAEPAPKKRPWWKWLFGHNNRLALQWLAILLFGLFGLRPFGEQLFESVGSEAVHTKAKQTVKRDPIEVTRLIMLEIEVTRIVTQTVGVPLLDLKTAQLQPKQAQVLSVSPNNGRDNQPNGPPRFVHKVYVVKREIPIALETDIVDELLVLNFKMEES